jgi:hypothetical protein
MIAAQEPNAVARMKMVLSTIRPSASSEQPRSAKYAAPGP